MKPTAPLIALLFLAACADSDPPPAPVAGDAAIECEMLVETVCACIFGGDECMQDMGRRWACNDATGIGDTYGECLDLLNECSADAIGPPCDSALVY